MTGTSINTPTTVASDAPEESPNSIVAVAMATSKWFDAPINALGAASAYSRRSAFARALEQKDEYVLPARFDDTEISGLLPTIGCVDLRKKTAEELGELILKKLG